MLEFILTESFTEEILIGQASERKLRLFACACCRAPSIFHLLRSDESLNLISAAERLSDGEETLENVVAHASDAPKERVTGHPSNPVRLSPSSQAERAVLALASQNAWVAAFGVVELAGNLLGTTPCGLLRDIFGPLAFRPISIATAVLAWNGGAIPRIAQGIYVERAFAHLPILADALHDAGCENEELIAHCRSNEPHTRGCWVLDLILGKN